MDTLRSMTVFLILAITGGRSLTCTNFTNIGDTKQLDVSASSSFQFVCIQLNNTLEPIRVSVESENATSRHPLLVTARQPMGVVSWTLPYVENGYSYSSIEQTLCPMLNRDDTGSAVLIIDFSTTQSTPLSVSLSTTLVTPFKLKMNTPVTLEASPSGPSYLLYEYEDLPPDRSVRVNFLSMDNTSDICAIASIQTSFCPVVNLLDNAGHRGRFQTMRSIASITTKENDTEPHFGYFYVVLSVLPDDGVDNSCFSTSKGLRETLVLFDDAEDNFNPTVYSGPERTKRVVITVELVDPNLAAAIAVPIVVYLFFVVFAIIWMLATLCQRQIRSSNNSQNQPGSAQRTEELSTTAGEGTVQSSGENGGTDINRNEADSGNVQETSMKFRVNLHMAELGEIDEPAVQKHYSHFSIYLLVIIVFYSIPAYQLVVTYQRLLFSSGNEDICYYNSLCAQPLDVTTDLTLSAFNNIFSNIGYIILGALYIGVACIRHRRYLKEEKMNSKRPQDQKKGVPQMFGIYYAIGLAMVGQAFMSIAYHLCPSTTNYQFDATFMYVMTVLGLFKVLTTRTPDLQPIPHWYTFFLMVIIMVVVLGGIWFQYLAFQIVFVIVYLVTTLYFSLEVYYRRNIGLKPKSLKALIIMYKKEGLCPPQHWPKLGVVIFSLVVNTVIAIGIFPAEALNFDFARYFLLIVLANFLIYLIYYLFAKCINKECCNLIIIKPVVYALIALLLWIASIWFFTQDVTDTSVSPALSRDNNRKCLAFGFYDSHDFWHFASSFALFFSFLILLALDEGQENKVRTDIKTF